MVKTITGDLVISVASCSCLSHSQSNYTIAGTPARESVRPDYATPTTAAAPGKCRRLSIFILVIKARISTGIYKWLSGLTYHGLQYYLVTPVWGDFMFSVRPLPHPPPPPQWLLLLTSKPFELHLRYLGQRKYRSKKCTGWPFGDLNPRSRLWHW